MTTDFTLAPPRLSAAHITAILNDYWGIEGPPIPLPSERDQNFDVTASNGDRVVVKIARPTREPSELAMEVAALQHVRTMDPDIPVPRVVATTAGSTTVKIDEGGDAFEVRVIEFLPGSPLAHLRYRPAALLERIGESVGTLTASLQTFDHPVTHRDIVWDLTKAPAVIDRYRPTVDDPVREQLLERVRHLWDDIVAPTLGKLRKSVIYNDANDHNVLVESGLDGPHGVTGLLDFGDMVHGPTVCDLAIALAYAMLHQREPLTCGSRVVHGFHRALPLDEHELDVLFPLTLARLAVSITLSAKRRPESVDNPYLAVSEQAAVELLERLLLTHPRVARGLFRDACGLDPFPNSSAVVSWIDNHGHEAASVVEPDPREVTTVHIDLSIGSQEVADPIALTGTPALTDRVFDIMARAGATIGVGRYDEARCLYTASAFARPSDDVYERRTIHIGVDLFLPPGAAVQTPFDGRVVSVRDNGGALDYGPTVVLEHTPSDGPPFYTLYGHLGRAVLSRLTAGDVLTKGARFAEIGTFEENGNWPPHLHLQVITDLLDYEGDFPGVAAPSERAVWTSACPDPSRLCGLAEDGRTPRADTAGLRAARREVIAPSLSLHYETPLHIERGRAATLYDAEGRAYLDLVNNVAHVGHGHPHVARALARQAPVLNTNTRYLHQNILEYARRLTALLPDPLSVCVFVNSGSEANDLALRMATAHTGGRGIVVLEGAYHGHTAALIDASPYKNLGPGGAGLAPHVRAVPMPDTYRGPYSDPESAGERYATHVQEALRSLDGDGVPPAAFLAESLLSCGGQIDPPAGYLRTAYGHAREAGAVIIADEVQIGLGRVGTHWWGFETQDAVPDIVTLGKPIGNGHPIGAVVTTMEIAASFDNGMEYFNTFGGNPVSCAVGLAVLEVMEQERLREHAHQVSGELLDRLRGLADTHQAIGDVRGRGLFIGVELVANRKTREPAPGIARYTIERLRERGILLSTDGPHNNVLKIKPPMVVTRGECQRFVAELGDVLERMD